MSVVQKVVEKVYNKYLAQKRNEEFNQKIEEAKKQMQQKFADRQMEQRIFQLEENIRSLNKFHVSQIEKEDMKLEYFRFEDHCRGSREHIKDMQKGYVEYFKGKDNVLDLGCGRGEFLELLKENEIPAIGVDFYPNFVCYCRDLGMNVEYADAVEYLKSQRDNSVGGIFASQLIEHLPFGRVVELCQIAHAKMQEGAYIIIETPNPASLSMFTHAFYIDPSHNKPVHPYTLQYVFNITGFKDVHVVYTDVSKLPEGLPELKGENIENMEEFNAAIRQLNDVIYGSQDYALIARR